MTAIAETSPARNAWTGRIALGLKTLVLLPLLFFVFFALGGLFVHPALPDTATEPGPLPTGVGLVVVSLASASVIELLVLGSRWRRWKLIVSRSLAYYGLATLLMQVETWYFLGGVTVGPELMVRLLLQGLPVAFLFVPLAVVVLGRARGPEALAPATEPPSAREWVLKLAVIASAYLVLYFGAGYFVAWRNPELRAFYGQPGPVLSFAGQMAHAMQIHPTLLPFQVLRALLWTAGAVPIVLGSRWGRWPTAMVVAAAFSVPQNVVLGLPNPLIPSSSVRLSHLVETASSSFVFGLIVGWLLYPRASAVERSESTQPSR
jgi:hypothetical protein